MQARIPLYTSRYQNRALIVESGLAPIRTTLGPPRFYPGYDLQGEVKVLAPSRSIFRLEGTAFDQAYRQQLEATGLPTITAELERVYEKTPARGLVLLCFEDVVTLGELACHRRCFARWWQEQTGQQVPELGRDVSVHDINPDANFAEARPLF